MNNTQDNKALNEAQQAPIISAREFWKSKFGEYPTNDADKLACVMMREYAQQFQLENKQVDAGVWVRDVLEQVERKINAITKIHGMPEKASVIGNSIVLFFKNRIIYKQSFINKEITEAVLDETPSTPISNEAIEKMAEKANAYEFISTKDGKRNAFNEGYTTGFKAALQQSSVIDNNKKV
jgi:hypothetical protein